MPRPGPRPYECIRRAWHSDSHHTLRGSLIQEIFRVVNEIHGPNTRRKKEWQEKLPMVVLRAEEILYSKANSEAEYMDLKTLCSRLEDAVNTMIRRDESTEGGKFLEPCVEAALSLGCLPRKASRGQRHNSRSCAGSSRRLTAPSAVPAIGKGSINESSLIMQAHKEKSGFHGNAVYCSSVKPAYHSVDSQQYCITSVTPGRPSSIVCNPSVDNLPCQKEAHFFYPIPCTTSHISSFNLNRQSVPSASTAPFVQRPFSSTTQDGRLLHLSQHQTRMETGLICMPVPWPLCPASTTSVGSSTWGIPTSYRPQLCNAPSIALSSDTDTARSAAQETSNAYTDSELQYQVSYMASQMRYMPQADLVKHAAALPHCEHNHNEYSPCKDIENNAKEAEGESSVEGVNAASNVNVYDLQLRLGPPGNPFSTVTINASCDVDSPSSNSGLRVPMEDQTVKYSKVNDGIGPHFSKSNHESVCCPSILNFDADVSPLRGFFVEKEESRYGQPHK